MATPSDPGPLPFADQLRDADRSVIVDLIPGSPVLVIAFGAVRQRLEDVAPYHFLRQVGVLDVSKVFLRDPATAWYHRGVPGAGEGIDALAKHLRGVVARSGASHVVTLGASAGGYAALLLGRLIGARVMLAFAPQTTIERATLLALGDLRYRRDLDPIEARGELDGRYLDLRPLFAAGAPRGTGTAHVHVADRLDLAHAARIGGLPGVVIHDHGDGRHNVAGDLLVRGELQPILLDALRRPASGRRSPS